MSSRDATSSPMLFASALPEGVSRSLARKNSNVARCAGTPVRPRCPWVACRPGATWLCPSAWRATWVAEVVGTSSQGGRSWRTAYNLACHVTVPTPAGPNLPDAISTQPAQHCCPLVAQLDQTSQDEAGRDRKRRDRTADQALQVRAVLDRPGRFDSRRLHYESLTVIGNFSSKAGQDRMLARARSCCSFLP